MAHIVAFEIDLDSKGRGELRRELPKHEGHHYVLCPMRLEEGCGAPSVGKKRRDFVAQREVSTEDEAAPQRLLVCERSDTSHGCTLTEATDDDAVGRNSSLNLACNQIVNEVPGCHGALLVFWGINRKTHNIGPCRHRHAAVERNRATPGIWKHPLDIWHVHFVRDRCPALSAVAEAVEPDDSCFVSTFCRNDKWG